MIGEHYDSLVTIGVALTVAGTIALATGDPAKAVLGAGVAMMIVALAMATFTGKRF